MLPAHDRARELDMGAYLAPRQRSQSGIEQVFTLFRVCRSARREGGHDVRGEQQMLAIGRALMARRAATARRAVDGIAPVLVDRIYETIEEIKQAGHDDPARRAERNYALGVSSRVYVLETGKVVISDSSDKLRSKPAGPGGLPRRRLTDVLALLGPRRSTCSCCGWAPPGSAATLRTQGLRREAGLAAGLL